MTEPDASNAPLPTRVLGGVLLAATFAFGLFACLPNAAQHAILGSVWWFLAYLVASCVLLAGLLWAGVAMFGRPGSGRAVDGEDNEQLPTGQGSRPSGHEDTGPPNGRSEGERNG